MTLPPIATIAGLEARRRSMPNSQDRAALTAAIDMLTRMDARLSELEARAEVDDADRRDAELYRSLTAGQRGD